MSGSIERYTSNERSVTRRTGRTLSQIQGGSEVAIARVEARADVQTAQVDAMAAVTQRGLQGAAFVTSVEMALAEATPAAMTRLKMVGDAGAMSIAQIVMDTASKLRRI